MFNGQSVAGSLVHAKPRSREAAKGKRMEGGEVCVELPVFSFQLSRIYSLWHGCHGPLTPDPSRPLSRGRGEDCVFGGQSVAAVWFTRSREAAKGEAKAVFGFRWVGRGFEVKCVAGNAMKRRFMLKKPADLPNSSVVAGESGLPCWGEWL